MATVFSKIANGSKIINRRIRSLRKKKAGIPLYPLSIETEYRKALLERLRYARALVNKYLVPKVPSLMADLHDARSIIKKDGAAEDLIGVMQQIRLFMGNKYTEAAAKQLAQDVGASTSIFNLGQTTAAYKRVEGVDPIISEPYLKDQLQSFAFLNTRLIQSVEEKYLNDIERKVFDGFTAGVRAEEIAKDITDTYGVSEKQAALIARDQIGKLNGEFNMLRLQNLGASKYEWVTMGDDRVRDEHAALNGEIFSWDNPPEPGNPGEDYNCRCIASPIFDEKSEDDGSIEE